MADSLTGHYLKLVHIHAKWSLHERLIAIDAKWEGYINISTHNSKPTTSLARIIFGFMFWVQSSWQPLLSGTLCLDQNLSVYVLSAPWIFFGLLFFMIGLWSVHAALVPALQAATYSAVLFDGKEGALWGSELKADSAGTRYVNEVFNLLH